MEHLSKRYRPQTFQEVLGQDVIVRTLKNAIRAKHIGHAYLFSGSHGTGKTSLARIFAKSLNCSSPSDGEPCNSCVSCQDINMSRSIDVLEIDGASHRSIEDIRSLNETTLYAASPGKFRIYIIDEVHMLTKEAFNALLKTLEEPPAAVTFLFATTEPHKLPATILSRCQKFSLQRIPLHLIVQKLSSIACQEHISCEEGSLSLIAEQADGALRDAESLFNQVVSFTGGYSLKTAEVRVCLGLPPESYFHHLLTAISKEDLGFPLSLIDTLYQEGLEAETFLLSLIQGFRALLHHVLKGAPSTYTFSSQESVLFPKDMLFTAIHLLIEAEKDMRFFPHPWIILEQTLYQLIRLPKKKSLEEIVASLDSLERRLSTTSTPPFPEEVGARPAPQVFINDKVWQRKIDTLCQFAAVELEGSLQKEP